MATLRRSQFFNSVYAIQFLRSADPKTGEELFRRVLEPGAAAAGVHARLFDVASREEFFDAMLAIIDECREKRRGPILHLETHGDDSGLGMQLGEWITWAELKPLLIRLNVIAKMNL